VSEFFVTEKFRPGGPFETFTEKHPLDAGVFLFYGRGKQNSLSMGRKKHIDLSLYKGRDEMLAVVQRYVKTGFKARGKDGDGAAGYYFLCPFHKERHASLLVSRASLFVTTGSNNDQACWIKKVGWGFKCLGCGIGGDIYEFFIKKEGVSFRRAVKMVRQMFPYITENILTDPNQLKLTL